MDLPGFLQRQYGFTKEEAQLAVYQGVFALNPDAPNVPVDFKLKVQEQKLAMQQRAQAEQAAAQQIEQYRYNLAIAARSSSDDKTPVSLAWYGSDRDAYTSALEQKALRMSAEASARGEYIDVSPPAVIRALEEELSSKFEVVKQKRTPPAPTPAAPPQTATTVASTVGATSGARAPSARVSISDASKQVDALIAAMLGSR